MGSCPVQGESWVQSSDTYEQEMGAPQGSILSPVLFSLNINNIVKSVLKGSEASLLMDDFALCIRANSLPHAETYATVCKQCAGLGL